MTVYANKTIFVLQLQHVTGLLSGTSVYSSLSLEDNYELLLYMPTHLHQFKQYYTKYQKELLIYLVYTKGLYLMQNYPTSSK